ncbi:triphosphoribosyl-dephospho-CoA synthase [Enhydrobacter aerosaccus]|uniref:triphosphoribosyl-dephospho-CoA synthase n=1 Tax=Enhydrobacter aerosaccus TaxID=225324 RepID=A0A1T4SZC9_9HYPH|nr:triphosphoribosyl-dephospho-CoA synthase MdcB [Enhydrobacter aerosaccus]SKA33288.1 triphosphoribosyl-dephospho-CoA synthase [Enhydrobacter aerosaccus]
MSPDAAFDAATRAAITDADLAAAAVKALHEELAAYPKPGLVSPIDSGSHADMDFDLMRRSADALAEPFEAIAAAGREGKSFEGALKPLGVQAERRMLAATGGVNTHRGAIFAMGMMVAAIAHVTARREDVSPDLVRTTLRGEWGAALEAHAADGKIGDSHGAIVRRATGHDGARREAALGFPSIFDVALPAYSTALRAGLDGNTASVQTLFTLMEAVEDTTVLYRGGLDGSGFVRHAARAFLEQGGCYEKSWKTRAEQVHRDFVARNLSAGGSADLLAVTILLFSRCSVGCQADRATHEAWYAGRHRKVRFEGCRSDPGDQAPSAYQR